MTFIQRAATATNKLQNSGTSVSSFLSVNPNIFAEIINETDSTYIFNIKFKLLIDKDRNIFDCDAVGITVKHRDAFNTTFSSSQAGVQNVRQLQTTGPSDNNNNSSYSILVKNRLYNNLNLLNDTQNSESYLSQYTVSLPTYFAEINRNLKYNLVEIFARMRRTELSSADTISQANPSFIDPVNSLHRINRELCSLTESIDDDSIKILSSESNLENPGLRMSYVNRGKSPLYFDIIKYYLREIPESPKETDQTWYEKRNVTKSLDYIDIEREIEVQKTYKHSNLILRFDLYKRGSCRAKESLSRDINMSNYVDAFENIFLPPTVRTYLVNNSGHIKLSIFDKNKNGYIPAFNIYKKSIDSKGNVENYKNIGRIENSTIANEFSFHIDSKLTLVRVVPLDRSNVETNVFSDIVIGPGHKDLGNITILPYNLGQNEIFVEVIGLHENTISVSLYRKDCTDNFNDSFRRINYIRINKNNNVVRLLDKNVTIGHVYEYYVVALSTSRDSKEEIPHYSNFVIYKNNSSIGIVKKEFSVNLLGSTTGLVNSEIITSFEIKTMIPQSENARITKSLKDQSGELYEQYLNPNSNSSSPLGTDKQGIPEYSDIFFHEVVRTNLNTSEREVFDLISNGIFIDNRHSQQLCNIKPINLSHTYIYQVFTFRKNPIELFKKFVTNGITIKGQDWFFSPYKWRTSAQNTGKLYADDERGPVISTYESLISESCGLTATYNTREVIKYSDDIEDITFQRINRNTNKIAWSLKGQALIYDTFVILKVVNGIRSIVGKTQKNYFYHQIKEEDLGTMYYIVLPITTDFKIDKFKFSNSELITPDGITPKTKVFQDFKTGK